MKQRPPTDEELRTRAYEIYLERGGAPGHELDDWLQAEYELMQLPVRKIAELKEPKSGKRRGQRSALVALVQLAMTLGIDALR